VALIVRRGRHRRVLVDREAEAEVAAAFTGEVALSNRDRMDMPDGALSLLDEAQRHYQGVDELLEVVLILLVLSITWGFESASDTRGSAPKLL
jgi:hypothetical protein